MYLHPLCLRILQSAHSSDGTPLGSTLKGRILQVDEITQTDEMRRRYKAFAHLPLNCEFSLVELDLSDVVSTEVLGHFASKWPSVH